MVGENSAVKNVLVFFAQPYKSLISVKSKVVFGEEARLV